MERTAIGQQGAAGAPIMKQRVIGEVFYGSIIKDEMRQQTDMEGNLRWKDEAKTKPARELVVHLLAIKGDMQAAIGGESSVPEPGEKVRVILRGGGWGAWIDATKVYGSTVLWGDVLRMTTTHATRYNSGGTELGDLKTNDEVMAWKQSPANTERKESIGFRGDVAFAAGDSLVELESAGSEPRAAASANTDPFEPAAPAAAQAVADHFGGAAVPAGEQPF